jgi:hypothetical protein
VTRRAKACPRPDKPRYTDPDKAWTEARRLRNRVCDGRLLNAYPCRCGYWHVGNARPRRAA